MNCQWGTDGYGAHVKGRVKCGENILPPYFTDKMTYNTCLLYSLRQFANKIDISCEGGNSCTDLSHWNRSEDESGCEEWGQGGKEDDWVKLGGKKKGARGKPVTTWRNEARRGISGFPKIANPRVFSSR